MERMKAERRRASGDGGSHARTPRGDGDRRSPSRWVVSAPIRLMLALLASTPSGAKAQSPAPPACAGSEYRVFDFWVGEWDVYNPQGVLVGTNSIQPSLNGCVLHEKYETSVGYAGESFNIYDATRRVWHQSWVDNQGLLLSLEGGLNADGQMVLEGVTTGADGGETKNRIRWSRLDGLGDRVRQEWMVSTDGGRSWDVAFDGEYRRRDSGS